MKFKSDINILKLIFGCLNIFLLSFLQSCNDRDLPDDFGNIEFEVPDGMVRLSMLVPDYDGAYAQFGSRAFDISEEGYMTNLYVIAIKYYNFDDNGSEIEIKDESGKPSPIVNTYALNPVGESFLVGEQKFHIFNMALYPGKYKFAVVANVDLYLSDRATKISDFHSEDDLKNLVLNFDSDIPLAPRHLPMVCLPENIRYKEKTTTIRTDSDGKVISSTSSYSENLLGGVTDENPDNLISIGATSTVLQSEEIKENVIVARMNFLCSKVRYTILFDKTGISSAFGSSWIRFYVDEQVKPWATNIRRQTKVVTESEGYNYDIDNPFITQSTTDGYGTENSSWTISLDRFYWHSTEGSNYPLSPKSNLTAWDGTTDNWVGKTQKVWQGVVYLPENTGRETYTVSDPEGNKNSQIIPSTVLKFPYYSKDNNLDETPEIGHITDPKELWLFGNPTESKFEGLIDSGEDAGNYSSEEGKYMGLDRNYFYDVVAKVVNPDVKQMDIRVFVSILPWHEVDQSIDETENTWDKSKSLKDSDSM